MPDTVKGKSSRKLIDKISRGGTKVLSVLSGVLALVLLTYSGYVLYDSFYTQNQAFSTVTDLFKYKPTTIIKDSDVPLSPSAFAEVNKDYRAWLTIDETKIDYPVVQGEDDLYYASHDVYNKSSLTGSIYLAAGNSSDLSDNYNIFFGHHMENGAMFGGLDEFRNKSYFDSHRKGLLVSKDGTYYDLTTFAVLETNAYEGKVYQVGNRDFEEIKSYLSNNASIYYPEVLNKATKIVAMSTCADYVTNGRLVIFAVAVETTKPTPVEPEPPVDPTPPEIIEQPDPEVPLGFLVPDGQDKNHNYWALVNLLAIIATAYILLPLLSYDSKFGRKKKMAAFNDLKKELLNRDDLSDNEQKDKEMILTEIARIREENDEEPDSDVEIEDDELNTAVERLFYNITKFVKRFRIGLIVQIALLIGSIILFILTENMSARMVIIDQWTPIMILFFIAAWVIDIIFIRYRVKKQSEQEETPTAEEQ